MEREDHPPGAVHDAAVIRYMLFCHHQIHALILTGRIPLPEALDLCTAFRDFFSARFPKGEEGAGRDIFDAVFAPELRDTIQLVHD